MYRSLILKLFQGRDINVNYVYNLTFSKLLENGTLLTVVLVILLITVMLNCFVVNIENGEV